jgi:hypothetical protein
MDQACQRVGQPRVDMRGSLGGCGDAVRGEYVSGVMLVNGLGTWMVWATCGSSSCCVHDVPHAERARKAG